jgi:NAD(P)-dependent dehydrogenase (short-subunit alcohol dehydrogenase family)
MSTVVITGANRGLGMGLTRKALEQGHRVLATAREPDKATELQALAMASVGRLSLHALDLADFGAITWAKANPFGQTDYDSWAEHFRVNAMAPMRLAERFADSVAASARKTMFFIASRVGPTPTFGFVESRSSKSAQTQVVYQCALALKPRGIICACAHPGWVATRATGHTGALTADQSAALLWGVIDRLTLADTGKFFEPDGMTQPAKLD